MDQKEREERRKERSGDERIKDIRERERERERGGRR